MASFRRLTSCAVLSFTLSISSLARSDEQVDRLRGQAEVAFKERDYRGCVNRYSEAYTLSREPSYILNIGRCYHYLQQHKMAMNQYDKYKSDYDTISRPLSSAYWRYYGETLLAIERWTEAKQKFQIFLEREPSAPERPTIVGYLFEIDQKLEEEKKRHAAARRHGLIIGVSVGTVAAAALAIGLGVGLAPRCPPSDLGCF